MDEDRKFRIIVKAIIRLNPGRKTLRKLVEVIVNHIQIKEQGEPFLSQFWVSAQRN